ncbi:hypothetical protein BBK36DRAFT_1142219 [Trichoderma citrinoviride]|uniref:Uncharacterized protein n=1 Tax=Trichoderma citrinoviride TaxID=58853 RepID=A0A2T4B7C5_9HYPO|nr:hypothetical protein BBK36DRAFT_1142219 [Trichoderma citrinoviride]PTB65225.1 hypothetical protein BBK36DRAFT_1142219 [Trichoderma citrinoviride]
MKLFFKVLPLEDWLAAYAKARRKSTAGSNPWKCKTIKEFRKYIAELAMKNKAFGHSNDISHCQLFLGGNENIVHYMLVQYPIQYPSGLSLMRRRDDAIQKMMHESHHPP